MSFVVSFSGLVGTGKTACARYVAYELHNKKLPAFYISYRSLSLKSIFEKKKQITQFKRKIKPPKNKKLRFENYNTRSYLTFLFRMFYYCWKVYFLFLLVRLKYRNDIVIVDRFIFDNIVNYEITDKRFQFLYQLFLKLLPLPELSFILYADFGTIMKERPFYDAEYIRVHLKNYASLKELYPNIVMVNSNQIEEKINFVFSTVYSYLNN
jgi:thymidylate kinase